MGTRLRQRLGLQPRRLQFAFIDRWLSSAYAELVVRWFVECASCCTQSREYLFIELDLAVEVLFGDAGEIFNLLRVVCLDLGHGRIEDCLAARGDLLVCSIGPTSRLCIPPKSVLVGIDNGCVYGCWVGDCLQHIMGVQLPSSRMVVVEIGNALERLAGLHKRFCQLEALWIR